MNSTLAPTRKELIRSAVDQLKGQFDDQVLSSIEEVIAKIEQELLLPLEALDLPPQLAEELYIKGYYLYQSGKFKEALAIFTIVNFLLMGAEPKLIFSMAACHHHLKDFIAAAQYYMMYQTFDKDNPIPFYHLYDCFQKTGHATAAEAALKCARDLAAKETKYTDLLHKIDLQLKNVEMNPSH